MKGTTMMRMALLGVLGAGWLAAAGPRLAVRNDMGWQAPVVGYVAAGEGALRRVDGIAGASRLGQTLAAGVDRCWLAPGHEYGLGTRSGRVLVLVLGPAAEVAGEIAGAARDLDEIVFSPGGTAAALVARGRGRVQVITGLPGEPRLTAEYPLAGASRLALSDDGQLVGARNGGVWFWRAEGPADLLFESPEIRALAFARSSYRLAVVDSARNQVTLVEPAAEGVRTRTLEVSGGFDAPSMAVFSADGAGLLVASAAARLLWWVELESGDVTPTELTAAPQGIDSAAGGQFLVHSGAESVWIFSRVARESRLAAVPGATVGVEE